MGNRKNLNLLFQFEKNDVVGKAVNRQAADASVFDFRNKASNAGKSLD